TSRRTTIPRSSKRPRSPSRADFSDTVYNASPMEPLTDRQAEILRLVRELTEVSGYPPTRAEIAEKMGFRSVNAAEQHLRALEKKGAIEISAGSSRGIRVRGGPRVGGKLLELPVIGRVAAGAPMLAEENVQ